ncbi:MAG TPA: heparinase II/III family protein [Tepidisphaeraceae bacterium]|jgi:hypothetical protein|nr:heparinase II/III family protein [Tepidisphaeraceae bacterium]
MQNIIRQPMSIDELAKVFARSPRFPLVPPMEDAVWQRVAANPNLAKWATALRDVAMTEIDQPLPPLSDELYAQFYKTGIRLPFERIYFSRRRNLARAVISTLIEPAGETKQRLLGSALSKMREVFNEESWALIAHTGHSPTGKDPLTLDLFSSETANQMGELLSLLGDHVPADLQQAIHRRLQVEIFDNYLNRPHYWIATAYNWNAVCHQGVLGAAMGLIDDPELLARLFHKAAPNLAIFLTGFTPDGGCSEGPGYWGYGFGWFMELNRQLELRTRGRLSLVEGDDHVRAISLFGPRVTLSNGHAVNFSDNGARSIPRGVLLQYLADRFNDDFIRVSAQSSWRREANSPPDMTAERLDLFYLLRHFLRCPDGPLDAQPVLPEGDIGFPDLGVHLLRFRDAAGHLWELAAKAGHNAEFHNHNDVGSYLLNIDGRRVLTEIGAPEYVREFFKEETRYTFLAARSLGHPLPLINGQEQAAGKSFAGTIAVTGSGDRSTIDIGITRAYPAEASCERCLRQIAIDKRSGRIDITDQLTLAPTATTAESAVVTEMPVTLIDGHAFVTSGKNTLRVSPLPATIIREIQRLPFNHHNGSPGELFRIVLEPKAFDHELTIGCWVELAAP